MSLDDSKVPLIWTALFEGDGCALWDAFGVLGAVGPLVGAVGPLVAKMGVAVPLGADAHPPPIAPMTIAKANQRHR
jgi:hypothetical protein